MITLVRTNRLGPVTPVAEVGDHRSDQQREKDAAAARADSALMFACCDAARDDAPRHAAADVPGSPR